MGKRAARMPVAHRGGRMHTVNADTLGSEGVWWLIAFEGVAGV